MAQLAFQERQRRVADDVVPVSVDEEVAGQRHEVGEAEGVGFQFVEGRPTESRMTTVASATFEPAADLIPDQFTLSNLRAPLGVLVLNEDLRRVEVLKVGVRNTVELDTSSMANGMSRGGNSAETGSCRHSSVT